MIDNFPYLNMIWFFSMRKKTTSILFHIFYIDLKKKNVSQQCRYLKCQFNSKRGKETKTLCTLFKRFFL